jgi:hypothetical protein
MNGPDKSSAWYRREWKTKPPTISDMIQSRRKEGRPYVQGELREGLIRREMARHNFNKKQALAGILAFCSEAGTHT